MRWLKPGPNTVGLSTVKPPWEYWARPALDSVYLTKAIPAGLGVPTVVMSMTCGEPW
jgi:cobalamin-dependent methionine synthase I